MTSDGDLVSGGGERAHQQDMRILIEGIGGDEQGRGFDGVPSVNRGEPAQRTFPQHRAGHGVQSPPLGQRPRIEPGARLKSSTFSKSSPEKPEVDRGGGGAVQQDPDVQH